MHIARKRKRNSKKKVKDKEATPEHNGTILLLALTLWDEKLEIHIPCPDAKALFFNFHGHTTYIFELRLLQFLANKRPCIVTMATRSE